MRHPNYSLKSVKKHTGREGPGYRALLVRAADGKVLAEVYDAGDGGCTSIYTKDADGYAEFKAYVAGCKLVCPGLGGQPEFEIKHEREGYAISEIFDDTELAKTFARVAKTALVFRLEGDDALSYRKLPLKGLSREAAIEFVRKHYDPKPITILA